MVAIVAGIIVVVVVVVAAAAAVVAVAVEIMATIIKGNIFRNIVTAAVARVGEGGGRQNKKKKKKKKKKNGEMHCEQNKTNTTVWAAWCTDLSIGLASCGVM